MLNNIQIGKISRDIIENLSDKQLSELENAMIRKIEECLKGGDRKSTRLNSSH